MTIEDCADLLSIEKQSHFDSWDKAFFLDCIKTKFSYVAEQDSSILAYGVFSIHESLATIMNLVVHPEHRRRGLGRRIMIHMCESANSQGASLIRLLVAANNSAARSLYRSFNFNDVNKLAQYYQTRMDFEDAIIMEKTLDPD